MNLTIKTRRIDSHRVATLIVDAFKDCLFHVFVYILICYAGNELLSYTFLVGKNITAAEFAVEIGLIFVIGFTPFVFTIFNLYTKLLVLLFEAINLVIFLFTKIYKKYKKTEPSKPNSIEKEFSVLGIKCNADQFNESVFIHELWNTTSFNYSYWLLK